MKTHDATSTQIFNTLVVVLLSLLLGAMTVIAIYMFQELREVREQLSSPRPAANRGFNMPEE